MAKSRTESPEIRKRQILNAARGLLSQKGYRNIKLDDVASKAGLAKGTLYLHFKDKEQIVRAVFEDLMDQQEEKLACVEQTSTIEQLEKIALIKLQFFHENRDFFSEFMHLMESLSPSNREGVKKRFLKHIDQIKIVMDGLMQKKLIPQSDLFLASFYYMSLIRMFWVKDQVLDMNHRKKSSKNFEQEVDTLMNLFLNGIQGEKKGKKS